MAKEGDHVKVITEDEEFSGILMPRPELLEKGVTVIKLDSGYNIGIDDERIKKIETTEEYVPKELKRKELKRNKALPTVSIISLGGTISSKIDYRTGGVYADYTAEDFVQMAPELAQVANIKARKAMSLMSEDITTDDWKNIAKVIYEELKSCDGAVVTQGTDTLHLTTAAMSFMLQDIGKPVIFSASQRSIDRGSTDAFMNLICAVTAAAKMDFSGIATCLHGTTNDDYCIINRGSKVRKMHTSRRDAFRPINELPLAKVHTDGRIEIINADFTKASTVRADPGRKPRLMNDFEDKVALIAVYVGMDPGVIDYYLDKGYKGLVLSATALGHVPIMVKGHSLGPQLERARKMGVPVVIASQTIYGRAHPYAYSNLRRLSLGLGCVFAEDMIPETAYIKLGWALGHAKDAEEAKRLILTDIAGEINNRHSPASFLY